MKWKAFLELSISNFKKPLQSFKVLKAFQAFFEDYFKFLKLFRLQISFSESSKAFQSFSKEIINFEIILKLFLVYKIDSKNIITFSFFILFHFPSPAALISVNLLPTRSNLLCLLNSFLLPTLVFLDCTIFFHFRAPTSAS